MMIDLTALAVTASGFTAFDVAGSQILAASDSDSNFRISWLFFLSGFIFYAIMFLRYRNSDKRHKHETETQAELADLKAGDQLARSLKGVSHSKMRDANNRRINGAKNSFFGL